MLLAGDLTQHGEVDEARVLAEACRGLSIPVIAVLGNHDWQSDRTGDLARTLGEAGMVVLERAHTILPIKGVSVGIAAVKGFVGGFDYGWANFGEPLFREAYSETTRDVEALERGLRAIAGCGLRIALLHYSPSADTLQGEPERLWLVLGAERLAGPIREHRPHLVLSMKSTRCHWPSWSSPSATGIDSPAEPRSIDMQWEWPLPNAMSSSQMFSVRRSQSSWA